MGHTSHTVWHVAISNDPSMGPTLNPKPDSLADQKKSNKDP